MSWRGGVALLDIFLRTNQEYSQKEVNYTQTQVYIHILSAFSIKTISPMVMNVNPRLRPFLRAINLGDRVYFQGGESG